MKIRVCEDKCGYVLKWNRYRFEHEDKEKIETQKIIEVNSFMFELYKICAKMKKEGYQCDGFLIDFKKKNKTESDETHDVDIMHYSADDYIDYMI